VYLFCIADKNTYKHYLLLKVNQPSTKKIYMKHYRFCKTIFLAIIFILSLADTVSAQADITSVVNYTPHFLICIIAGVILALGFQLLLTMTSVASGVSFIPNLEPNKNDYERRAKIIHSTDEKESSIPIGLKITSAMGLWTMLTASISLFFACLLAVKLSLLDNISIGIVLGLVIWATFYIIMMYLEARSISSLMGGLFNMAFKGIRSSFQMLFGKSKEDKIAGVIENSIHVVRREIAESIDNSKINKRIDKYIEKLKPRELNIEQIRKEMTKLLESLEIEEQIETKKLGFEKKHFIRIAEKQSHLSMQDIKKLAKVFMEVYAASKLAGPVTDKILAAFGKLSPGNAENATSFKEKIEDYLRRTGREELNPENLQKDIEYIIHHPQDTKEVISNRLKLMDRSTLVALLAQRQDIGEEEANKITNNIMKAIDFVKEKLGLDGHTKDGNKHDGTGLSQDGESIGLMEKLESRIRTYLDSLDRPEFNYEGIKRDFEQIFHDPRAGYELLKSRISLYDKESMIALLCSKGNITKEDAERIATKIIDARDNVINKAKKIEDQAKLKMEEAKIFVLQEAEATRKTTVSAAWWLVATSVISGIAAVLGGIAA
jgi:hypothetical protein